MKWVPLLGGLLGSFSQVVAWVRSRGGSSTAPTGKAQRL